MSVKVDKRLVSGSAKAHTPGSQLIVGAILLAGLLLVAVIALPRSRFLLEPVILAQNFEAANPEVRQAERYAAEGNASSITGGNPAVTLATNPELAAAQRYEADRQEAMARRLLADNPELRFAERYRLAHGAKAAPGFLSTNPEVGQAQRYAARAETTAR